MYLACGILEERFKCWSRVEIEEVGGLPKTDLLSIVECLGISILVVDENYALKLIDLLNLIWTAREANYWMLETVVFCLGSAGVTLGSIQLSDSVIWL